MRAADSLLRPFARSLSYWGQFLTDLPGISLPLAPEGRTNPHLHLRLRRWRQGAWVVNVEFVRSASCVLWRGSTLAVDPFALMPRVDLVLTRDARHIFLRDSFVIRARSRACVLCSSRLALFWSHCDRMALTASNWICWAALRPRYEILGPPPPEGAAAAPLMPQTVMSAEPEATG